MFIMVDLRSVSSDIYKEIDQENLNGKTVQRRMCSYQQDCCGEKKAVWILDVRLFNFNSYISLKEHSFLPACEGCKESFIDEYKDIDAKKSLDVEESFRRIRHSEKYKSV